MLKKTWLIASFALVPCLPATAQTCDPNIPPSTLESDFTDNGDGTVTHKIAGLVWMRCALGQTWSNGTCGGTAQEYSWYEAFQAASDKNAAGNLTGRNAWRVPALGELLSIVEKRCTDPAIRSTAFPNTPSGGFWSASPYAGNSNYAWPVLFGNGGDYYSNKSSALFVRLARGGQLFDSLKFKNKTGVELNQTITSNTITLSGILDSATQISSTGGTFSINGGFYDSLPTPVKNGDQIQVQTTSSGKYGTEVTTTVTIGYASGTFTVTTKSATTDDIIPDPFHFTDQTDATSSTQVVSDTITVTGINAPAPIKLSVTGGSGSYSINDGAFTFKAGTVKLDDKVQLRVTTPATPGATVSATLTIGGVSDTWEVTTKSSDTPPPTSDWTQVEPAVALRPSVSGGGSYGQALAVSGDWLWVGAPNVTSDGFRNRGVAYLWQHTAQGDWQAVSAPVSQGQAGDAFGSAVAVNEDWAAVGAPKADLGVIPDFGKAYLYQRQGTAWQLSQPLITPDFLQGQFGGAVALSETWLAVGAPGPVATSTSTNGDGSVYLYSLQNGTWVYRQTLSAPQPAGRFGASLALDGDQLIVGAPTSSRNPGDSSGLVHAYRFDGSEWQADAEFPLPDLNQHSNGQFGAALALQGNTLAVAAPLMSIPDPNALNLSHPQAGRVFLYSWDDGTQAWKLGGSFLQEREFSDKDRFGTSLTLADRGQWLLVGTPGYEPSKRLANAGRAYLYQITGSGPTPAQQFEGTGKNHGLGRSVAMLPNAAFIGAQNGKLWWYQAK